MPIYTYKNPVTGETRDIEQSTHDDSVYVFRGIEWQRVDQVHEKEDQTKPQAAGDGATVACCPNGHGALREWSGQMRCWTCGWPDERAVENWRRTNGLIGGPDEKQAFGNLSSRSNGKSGLFSVFGLIVAAVIIGYAAQEGVDLPPKIGVWGTLLGAAIGWVIGTAVDS